MGFKRFVEIGRVAVISYGPDSGKLCTIVDVIDHNRVLVDGPAAITGVHRHELGINRIMLTDLKVAAKHNASHKQLAALWKSEDVQGKWDATNWAKKIQKRKLRASMTDFDRFQVMLARKERSAARKAA